MNILVLEDRGSVAHYMNNDLTELGYTVFDAFSIPDAQSYLDTELIDCLIVDLNLDPHGLTQGEIDETKNGLLSGWVWLRNYAFRRDPLLMNRTIILSEYTSALEEYVPSEERKGIRIISKQGSTGPAEKVLDSIRIIERSLKKQP